jgi:hypothetical protein
VRSTRPRLQQLGQVIDARPFNDFWPKKKAAPVKV